MSDQDLQQLRQIIKEETRAAVKQEVQPIQEQINDPETGLKALGKQLNDPETGLKAINEKMDIITGEIYEVKQLVKQTLDVVRVEQQVRKQEIDQTREQLGLPHLRRPA